ncbi:sialate O-acetylesterase [Chryseolinea serpens]|uniref:Sialate O-acetylesterase n=1 Tax=Chryseolinea serpens TaxID=947013 RepID=A0A1M5TQ82_9BACT|nr:sialate O-acetylesterase [Chryseolinea serpens]SHH52838.1 sialate O-acetylesterase [Chryseolinea serpens]
MRDLFSPLRALKKTWRCWVLFGSWALLLNNPAIGQVRLPRLIGENMVLQRDTELTLWGWAAANEAVTVVFSGKKYPTKASTDGKWVVKLPPQKAGGPFMMDILASNQITLKNILVGDVWLCSGQSNMVLPMERVKERYAKQIAEAGNPFIRQFLVPITFDFAHPKDDLTTGSWQAATPANVLTFSATAYFFARSLYEKYHVPIGLINASVGGSPAEAWLSGDALKAFPEYVQRAQKFQNTIYTDSIRHTEGAMVKAWYNALRKKDEGMKQVPWFETSVDAAAWPTMQIPGYWTDQGLKSIHGVVWFRKDIDVPASFMGKPAKLLLGRIVDSDSVYVNGMFIGATGYQYPPRRYTVPDSILKAGKNTIVVRVINTSERGGFIADKPYTLSAGGEVLDLKGTWQYKVGAMSDTLPPVTFFQYTPGGLFNGMIAPVTNFAIKGAIWYQGESNTMQAAKYHAVFSAVITDWRKQWGQGDFPFLFVQLANYLPVKTSEKGWPELREAQRKTLSLPNTGMAVTIDIGEWNDLHPLNKEDVGKRLALAAQHFAYHDKKVVHTGPTFLSMRDEGNKLILTFANIGSGLSSKGEALKHFTIAGVDKNFVEAQAVIRGREVVVWSDGVSHPVAVRYGWEDNPQGGNLYNNEGLPASPFRTDDEP